VNEHEERDVRIVSSQVCIEQQYLNETTVIQSLQPSGASGKKLREENEIKNIESSPRTPVENRLHFSSLCNIQLHVNVYLRTYTTTIEEG